MKNTTNPVQKLKKFHAFPLNLNIAEFHQIYLTSNEFYDKNDYLGLFDQNLDPHEFLQIDEISKAIVSLANLDDPRIISTYPNSDYVLPVFELKLMLS